MSQEQNIPPATPRKCRRVLRVLVVLALTLVAFAVWLNGPGMRWLLPKIAAHFLQKQGMVVTFEAQGSLLGGLSLHRFDLSGGPVVRLQIEGIQPYYDWRELIGGKARGIQIHDVVLDLDLDQSFPAAPDAKTKAKAKAEPFDIAKLVEMIRNQREKVSGHDVGISLKSIHVHHSGKPVVEVGPTELRHAHDQSTWNLSVGEIVLSGDRKFPVQQNVLDWRPDEIALDHLGLSADMGISGLVLTTPSDLRPSLRANLQVMDSRFELSTSPDVETLEVRLAEGALDFTRLAELLGAELPVQGRLDECVVQLTPRNLPIHGRVEPAVTADGSVSLRLTNMAYRDQRMDECVVNLKKSANLADLSVRTQAWGASQSLVSQVAWDRDPATPDDLKNLNVRYDLQVPRFQPMLLALRPLMKLKVEEELPLPPESALSAKGDLRLQGEKIGPLHLDLALKAADPAIAPFSLVASMADVSSANVELQHPGIAAKGTYDLENKSYQASADLTDFSPQSLSPWLDWMGVKIPAGIKASLQWQGRGVPGDGLHQGGATIQSLVMKREGSADIVAKGQTAYEWPQSVDLSGFSVKSGTQEANLDASFAGHDLYVSRLTLTDAGKTLVHGKALIPIPEKMSGAGDFLTQRETLDVSLQSVELPLETFNKWLPKDKPLPVSGKTKLDLQITGSPAAPVISGDFYVKDVKSPSQSKLPPVDLVLNLVTADQSLQVSGQLLTSRTSPVTVKASLPFRPQQWAEQPESMWEEKISADVVIPRFELIRFKDLLQELKELNGVLEGAVTVKGTLKSPDIRGRLDLTKLSMVLPNEKIPPIRNGGVRLTFADRTVKLESLGAQLAGGELKASGIMRLPEQGDPALDFTIRGTALPLWRDAAVIARANADIRVAGPWKTALVSGSVRIVDSLVYKDFDLIPIGKPFTLPQAASLPALDSSVAAKATQLPDPFGNWRIDVTLKTEDPFLIRGNLARGSVTADARVTGTLGSPRPLGKAVIKNLTASLPLSKLTIPSGNVILTPASGLDPVLDIRGTSRISNYDVNIYVYGAVSAPKMLLTSEPPLPENEIMTLLATGTTTEGLSDGATAQNKGTQLLIEELRRGRLPMGKRLMPLLSLLDDVELAVGEPDPYSGKKRASATIPVRSHYFLYGGVDGEGQTRSLLMYELRFR